MQRKKKYLDERGTDKFSKATSNFGLSNTSGTYHKDVLGDHFIFQIGWQFTTSPSVSYNNIRSMKERKINQIKLMWIKDVRIRGGNIPTLSSSFSISRQKQAGHGV